jgi:peptidoglycan/LPS O-acetylase OafA/YrhL
MPSLPERLGRARTILAAMTPFPGFDGLRLAAALLVLVSHAMFTRAGAPPGDPVAQALANAGVGGVYVFFIISGFLLSRSLDREGDALRFAVNRVLRIYPGFVACVLVTALVFGAVGSSLPAGAYFTDIELLRHLRLTLDCLCSNAWLPGIWNFDGDAAMRRVVNGSLWSLSAEVLSYLLLLALWLLVRSVTATVVGLVGLTLATRLSGAFYDQLAGVAFTLPYFAGGATAYLVVRRFGVRTDLALASLVASALAAFWGLAPWALATFGAYALVWAGARPNPLSGFSARVGDWSYGVYLYGWPVQQLVRMASPWDTPWVTVALSLPMTLVCAWLSYRLVEAPALRLKAPATAALGRVAAWGGGATPAASRAAGTAIAAAALAVLLWPQPVWWWVSSSLLVLALASVAVNWAANGTTAAWRAR